MRFHPIVALYSLVTMTTEGMATDFRTEDSDIDDEVSVGSRNNNVIPEAGTSGTGPESNGKEGEISEPVLGGETDHSRGDQVLKLNLLVI